MNDFMSIIYIIISIVAVVVVGIFLIQLLPVILIIVLAFWIGKKIFKTSRSESFRERQDDNSSNRNVNQSNTYDQNDLSNKKVIDVDYEEVDK
ncbi:hypothetical protein SAMN05444401_0594 [Clostridium amylolyticum]|uniref:DUF4834 domain-containing protein n=1 Tax=Clostridium amylolyticum TaxID=1121298 RepID=A0A1M6B109_9CLOT|nr:hypothetical protein [Clostridium amylolyticum]SHI42400.1 hypothetical protein SAMN05444401_0594 [Clostridium amylolyticum]